MTLGWYAVGKLLETFQCHKRVASLSGIFLRNVVGYVGLGQSFKVGVERLSVGHVATNPMAGRLHL